MHFNVSAAITDIFFGLVHATQFALALPPTGSESAHCSIFVCSLTNLINMPV